MIRWFRDRPKDRPTLDFDGIRKTTEPFLVEGGRYGLVVDGHFPSGCVVSLGIGGLVSDRIPVTKDLAGPSYVVLDLIRGPYILSVGQGAKIYARLVPIG